MLVQLAESVGGRGPVLAGPDLWHVGAEEERDTLDVLVPEEGLQVVDVALGQIAVVGPVLAERVSGVLEVLLLSQVQDGAARDVADGQRVLEDVHAQEKLLACSRQ